VSAGRRSWGDDEKARKAAMVAQEIAESNRRRSRTNKHAAAAARKKRVTKVKNLVVTGHAAAVRPEDQDILARLRKEPYDNAPTLAELGEVQSKVEEIRARMMARSVAKDALDPSSLDGQLTLPPEVLALIEKEKFEDADLKRCILLIGRDNLAYVAALFKAKDERVRLEAMRLLRDILFADKKVVEHSGPDGGAIGVVIKLVAPDGATRTVERPKLLPAPERNDAGS
jgi:hypothetical protein